jgi:hypothetical protein
MNAVAPGLKRLMLAMARAVVAYADIESRFLNYFGRLDRPRGGLLHDGGRQELTDQQPQSSSRGRRVNWQLITTKVFRVTSDCHCREANACRNQVGKLGTVDE